MGHNYYAVAVPFSPAPTTKTLAASTYTITLDDVNCYIRATGAVTITIPTNTTVPFPIDTDMHFCQRGGVITFTPAGGVTLNFPTDSLAITAVVGAIVSLRKVGTNEWDLFGRLKGA
jgi:hypothetical protein